MGTSILDGVLSKSIINFNDIFIVEPNKNQRNLLIKKGICVFKNISEVNIKKLGIKALLIAVKPQILQEVAHEIKEHIHINFDKPEVKEAKDNSNHPLMV